MRDKTVKIAGVLKKHKTAIFCCSVVGLVFLLTRLVNLLAIPMFNDEAIYIRWAEIFSIHTTDNIFISLSDGKQPLFIWLMGVSLRVFEDPLLAGRLVSVLSGAGSILGIYLLTKELFRDKPTAILAVLLYIIFPYTLLYDRMALYDSLLVMFATWSLYLEVVLVRRPTFKHALITGLVIGGGMLTKSGAVFFLLLLPVSILLFPHPIKLKTVWRDKRLMLFLRWGALAIVVALALFSILRLSHDFRYIASKNGEFTLTIGQWLQNPFGQLPKTVSTIVGFIVGYSTWPFLIVVGFGIFFSRSFIREKLLLLAWAGVPLTAFALFAKLLYPRYILFMLVPFLPLGAYALTSLYRSVKQKQLAIAIVLVLFVPMLRLDYLIVTDFAKAPIPELDRYAYIEGYYSGVGVKDIVSILEKKSRNEKIYVATHGGFGIMPYSLQNYLYKNSNVIIESFAGIGPSPPSQVTDATKRYPTYHVFSAPCDVCDSIGVAPKTWNTKEIYRKQRIEKNSYITLVEVLPAQEPSQ